MTPTRAASSAPSTVPTAALGLRARRVNYAEWIDKLEGGRI